MRFDYGADNRKSYAHALRLCREKRIEDILEIAGRYTGAGVANPDFCAGARKVRGYADLALFGRRFGYRLHCIDNQIQNDLLQLNSITLHVQVSRSRAALEYDIAPVSHRCDKSDD